MNSDAHAHGSIGSHSLSLPFPLLCPLSHSVRGGEPQVLAEYLKEKGIPWGSTPRQPMSECLEGLLTLILRTIENQVSSEKGGKGFVDDLKITQEEMLSWIELVNWEFKEEKMNTSLG